MLCAFLGLPSFASSCDDILWHSVYTTGRWDLLKVSIVSALSKRAARLYTNRRRKSSIEVAHISTIFVKIVFSLVCSTSSYSIERVTELSCLLYFYISDFWFLPASYFYHNTFLACLLSPTVGVVWWPGLLYLEWGTTDITSCAPWSVTSLVTG